ncbi:patatin-like phospholipase family protein [Fredinandcohnia quinoae]|uniref:Patatin-like phospholipase family protein n=1 Tax=Fredinandcohnia quinoae TaxID=2918902 RepID=A0AAW5E2L6_9BACI|nr:patatin-like phospholipase family protein [Fredinandcohnia sp. SECRCQ15]MCH1626608.1 patatin-like phospholipase family protein [Fredinandcohnia sp. SECRCQ15]
MYIDGVFSGGGIKGFALIGAYQAIEERGYIFQRLAGTSAGSLIAALIAAGYTSSEIIKFMDELEVSDLLDPRRTILPTPLAKWLMVYWRLGLYKGDALEKWITTKLAQKGVYTFKDLPPNSLRIIASDLTNGKILVLPNDLERYGIIPESFSVAKAVRMSCSLPYFFEPVRLKDHNGNNVIVDGGVLSNFPIWLFDEEQTLKKRPVLGIKLSADSQNQKKNKINNAIDLFGALFETMKNAHDARYISRRHERNIIFIPMEAGLTTDFGLTDEKKLALTKIGKERAEHFFRTWCY